MGCKFTLRDAWPLMFTMKPTPQAAFSNFGSNKDVGFVVIDDGNKDGDDNFDELGLLFKSISNIFLACCSELPLDFVILIKVVA